MYYSEYRRKRSIETTKTVLKILHDDSSYDDDLMVIIHKIEDDYNVTGDVAIGVLRDIAIGYSKMLLKQFDRQFNKET